MNFSERIGHSFVAFANFFVIFAGVGPYQREIHRKQSYNDMIIYDSNTNNFVKIHSVDHDLENEDKTKIKFLKTATD